MTIGWRSGRSRRSSASRSSIPLEGYDVGVHDARRGRGGRQPVERLSRVEGGGPDRPQQAVEEGNGLPPAAKTPRTLAYRHTYLNIDGTFYYLCSILDGYSRYIVHWEIRESMNEADVETVLQRAGKIPGKTPRIISDNGPQFIAKDSRSSSAWRHDPCAHSPYYPQSNGKIERWHGTLKSESSGLAPRYPRGGTAGRRQVRRALQRGAAPTVPSATSHPRTCSPAAMP